MLCKAAYPVLDSWPELLSGSCQRAGGLRGLWRHFEDRTPAGFCVSFLARDSMPRRVRVATTRKGTWAAVGFCAATFNGMCLLDSCTCRALVADHSAALAHLMQGKRLPCCTISGRTLLCNGVAPLQRCVCGALCCQSSLLLALMLLGNLSLVQPHSSSLQA